jgi:outer membrane protein OmpA-like peptidoglycan-associated protein
MRKPVLPALLVSSTSSHHRSSSPFSRFARACGLVSASLTLLAGNARADAPGFAINRFNPAERGSDWFVVESLDLRGQLRPSVGLGSDFSYRSLVVYRPDGEVRRSIIRNSVVLHTGGSLVLSDRVRFGLDIPVALYQDGKGGVFNGETYRAPRETDLGDARLGADFRLFGKYEDAFTLAAGAQLFLPTGTRAAYTGDETFRLNPRLMAAGRVGPLVYGGSMAFAIRAHDQTLAGTELGSEWLFDAAAGVKVADDNLVIGPELYGSTIISGDGAFKTRNTPVEGLLGAHYTFLEDFRLGTGIGNGWTRGYGSPVFRWVASLEWVPHYVEAPRDRDRDGIPDNVDACPDTPGIPSNDPATNGCPPPPDRDGDGIIDADDACPDAPGLRTDDPKTNGCPDRDDDGIVDPIDACPDVPGVKTDDPKTNGCPSDRDRDGVIDAEDACPDEPGIKTDDPKTNGCPPPKDRDGDGILDPVDACPDEPGPPNPDPKKNGCPVAFVKEGQIRILEQVKFRFGKAELDPAGDPILEAVKKILVDHPEIKKVRVEGHTDNKGAAALNMKLSADRAAAVVSWLVKHGIDKKRLTSQGLGLTKPIDSNDTEEGRANNRRVEFHITETDAAGGAAGAAKPEATPAPKPTPASAPAPKPGPKPAPKP